MPGCPFGILARHQREPGSEARLFDFSVNLLNNSYLKMKKKKEIVVSSHLGLKDHIKRWFKDVRSLWKDKSVKVFFGGCVLLGLLEVAFPWSKYRFLNISASFIIVATMIILIVYIESKKHKS